jgi:predicted lactoylglutathione lyase
LPHYVGGGVVKFNHLIPELSVTNIEKSKYFYCNVLGFELIYERVNDNFAFLTYQKAQIMIGKINDNCRTIDKTIWTRG